MRPRATEHRPLCTLEMVAEGHAGRCPGAECDFWDDGCVLSRIELELDGRPEVAQLLLDLRGALSEGHEVELQEVHLALALARALDEDEQVGA